MNTISEGEVGVESPGVDKTGGPRNKTKRTYIYLAIVILVVAISAFFMFGLQQKQTQLTHTNSTTLPPFTNATTTYLFSLVKSYNATDISAATVYNTSFMNYIQSDNISAAQSPFSGCIGNTSIKLYVQGATNASFPFFGNISKIDASVPIKEYLRTSFLNHSTYQYYLNRYVGDGGICDSPASWTYILLNSTYSSRPIKVVGGSPAYLIEFSNMSKQAVERLGIFGVNNSSDLVIYLASAFYKNIYVASMSLWVSPKYASPDASITALNETLSQMIAKNIS